MDNNYGNGSYGNNGYGPNNGNGQGGYPQNNYDRQPQGMNNQMQGYQQNNYGQPQGMNNQMQQGYGQSMGGYQQNNQMQGYQQNNYGQSGYMQSPNYGQPAKKRKGGLVVGIIAGISVVGLVIGGVLVVLNSNPKTQITKAAKKTFEEPYVIEAIADTDFEDAKGCLVKFNLEDKTLNGKIQLGLAVDDKINFNMNVDYEGSDVDGDLSGNISLVDYEIACKLDIQEMNMQFKFDLDKQSDLIDEILIESGMTISELKETIDDARESASSSTEENNEKVEKLADTWEEYLANMKFEKEDKEKVTIDGEEVECKTFNALLSKEETEQLLDDMYAIIEIADTEGEFKAEMNNMVDELFDGEDIHLCVGIYKGALAKISLKHGDLADCDELALEFNGGEFRAQNMQLVADDEIVIKIEGKSDETEEEYTLLVDESGYLEEVMSYEFNKSTGKLDITVEGETLSGKLNTDSGIVYTTSSDDMSFGIEIEPIKDTVVAVDIDDKYYINDMNEEELMEMIMELSGIDTGYIDPGYEYTVIDEPETNLSGDILDTDGKITVYVDGTPITLGNTKYAELESAGWTFNKDEYKFEDGTTTLASGEYTFSTIELTHSKYGDDWDSATIIIGLCNPTSSDLDLYDAYIWSISADSRYGFELLNNYPVIALSNGICTGTDYKTVTTLMGEHDSIYESDYGYDSLDYTFDDVNVSIDIYDDGGVSSIDARDYSWGN